jgi:hypothetical protein
VASDVTARAGYGGATALRGLNASAALVIALEATYPDSSGLASASALIGELRADVTTWSKELLDGTHPAIALLSSGSSAPHASTSGSRRATASARPATFDRFAGHEPVHVGRPDRARAAVLGVCCRT